RGLAPYPPVLAENIGDLTAAHSDVPGRDVRELPDVPLQLGHERLAEPHDLAVALSVRVEVRAALASAHGERGQRILEHLLEGEELQQAQIDGWMEPEAALVRADGAVHLDSVTTVDLNHPGVV